MNLSKKINKSENKEFPISIILFFITYFLLFYLNFIFPTQSDDIGRKCGGIEKAIESYMHWNGRFGELLLVSFGSYFSTTIFYPFVNAFIGTSVIMMIYILILGHLPQYNNREISLYSLLVLFILFDPVFSFGSVFYWAAGTFNYLWSWFFLLVLLIPISMFWHKKIFSQKNNLIICLLYIPLGLIAGWSSEFNIVIILLWICSIVYLIIKNIHPPIWYYTSLISLIIGWLILYKCPGLYERALNVENYTSLSTLLQLSPIELTKKIILTFENINKYFYFENFFLISLVLLLINLIYEHSFKNLLIILSEILLLTIFLFCFPRFFFMIFVLITCLFNTIYYNMNNKSISNHYIFVLLILITEFLFIGATIQINIPKRACFQFTILNFFLIAEIVYICFNKFQNNILVQKIALYVCVFLTLIFSIFVIFECTKMKNKWKLMECSIKEQKSKGLNDIIIDKSTFDSEYWNYGDWENPGEDPNIWPNTTYADYYEVDTVIVQ